MKKLATFIAVLAFSTITYAAPYSYTLPTSDSRPYSKLSRKGVDICWSWQNNGRCNLQTETRYKLHRYNANWRDYPTFFTTPSESGGNPNGGKSNDILRAEIVALRRAVELRDRRIRKLTRDIQQCRAGL